MIMKPAFFHAFEFGSTTFLSEIPKVNERKESRQDDGYGEVNLRNIFFAVAWIREFPACHESHENGGGDNPYVVF
jgi:hypothetical protein